MDKVIIDGIDVSECVYASNSIPIDCENDTCFCYENPDCYYKQLKRLQAENERLKEEKSKLLSKCIDKQCRINELQQICAIKEFSLKVNGKKYKNLSGIDKAKLFINDENAIRDRYIQKLENKMSDLQCKFYDNRKKVFDAQKQIDKYRQALQEIRDIADNFCESHCPYSDDEETNVCNESCLLDAIAKPIIDKINSVIGAE